MVWLAISPGCACSLAAVAGLAAPALEKTPGTSYEAAGSRVLANRPVLLPDRERPRLAAACRGRRRRQPPRP